jgi:hypothetical protein
VGGAAPVWTCRAACGPNGKAGVESAAWSDERGKLGAIERGNPDSEGTLTRSAPYRCRKFTV